uniref:THAP-type domain-containing protein n=1 Tax=Glossina morsitans morsitans TaxID=37546 RepID=A0ABK9NGZ6_GLOMM
MKYCIVQGCNVKSTSGDKVTMFDFPPDKPTRLKWLENIGVQAKDLNTATRVCSRHFETKYAGKRLRRRVVPTLHLGDYQKAVHQNTISASMKKRRCAIDNCRSDAENRFFRIPASGEKRKTWLNLCKLDDRLKHMFLCWNHFNESDIKTNRLAKGAVPCKNLFTSDDDSVKLENVDVDANREESENSQNSFTASAFNSSEQTWRDEEVDENSVSCTTYEKTEILERKQNGPGVCETSRDRGRDQEGNKWLAEIALKNQEIIQLKSTISALKTKLQKLENSSFIIEPDTSKVAFAFSKMICGAKSKKFTEDQKRLAQHFFSVSAKCYNFMRGTLEFTLPNDSSFCRADLSHEEDYQFAFEQVFIPKGFGYDRSNNLLDSCERNPLKVTNCNSST